MPSALMKIFPPTTIGCLVAPTRFTTPSSTPGVNRSVLSKKRLPPIVLGISRQPYKLHLTLFSPRIVHVCPPEELLASNYPWIFRIPYKPRHSSIPGMPSVLSKYCLLQTNLGLLGGSTSYNIKLPLYPTTSRSSTSYQV
ncbi:hypothetical protein QL285_057056 [Trifolium repens]|nr:hypothetical protein QL285_057056 [Trifolium repens]